MINTFNALGRIGQLRDYKHGKSENGEWSIQGFSLALFGGWRKGVEPGSDDAAKTLWVECTARNHTADKVSQCKPGDLVFVKGRFEVDEYTSKDGEEVQRPVLIVESFLLACEGKRAGENPNPETGRGGKSGGNGGNRSGTGYKRRY